MDILGMQKPPNEEMVVLGETPPKGTVADPEWLHMALEVEEKQYVTQISR